MDPATDKPISEPALVAWLERQMAATCPSAAHFSRSGGYRQGGRGR